MKRSVPIGRYHLLDRVAGGGMADVYRAKTVDPDGTERLVAMKRVLEQYADDPSFVRMLIAEYRLSMLLVHPNIARIYELLRTQDGYFIAMEYVDGKDLRATMYRSGERRRSFDPVDAAYLMARAVDGLHHAHTAAADDGQPLHLVHRDFSPSNILVAYDGTVKIIDFGIAKADVDRERTAQGIIKGKVRYMSPEQAQGDPRLTGQSDVFSAGSVLYELLSGVPAFSAPSEVDLIYAVRRAEPVPLPELAPHVPEALAEIVATAMARQRRDRFASAAAFRDALVGFVRSTVPGYRRTRLANFMRSLWMREIDLEIRTLLEFALSEEPAAASEDLLASASVAQSVAEVSRAFDLAMAPDAPASPSSGSAEPREPSVVAADDLFASELNGPSPDGGS